LFHSFAHHIYTCDYVCRLDAATGHGVVAAGSFRAPAPERSRQFLTVAEAAICFFPITFFDIYTYIQNLLLVMNLLLIMSPLNRDMCPCKLTLASASEVRVALVALLALARIALEGKM
jgi:hypothetical protein